MATVAYEGPKHATAQGGPGFANMLGLAFVEAAREEESQKRMKALSQVIGVMESAGSRDKALEAMRLATPHLGSVQDMNLLYRYVDERYPQGDATMEGVTAYGPEGQERKVYVPKSHLGVFGEAQLQSHQDFAGMPEEERQRWSLTKPGPGQKREAEKYYRSRGDEQPPEYVGMFAPGSQPPDSFSMSELEFARKGRTERRQAESADRSERYLAETTRKNDAILAQFARTSRRDEVTEKRRVLEDGKRYFKSLAGLDKDMLSLSDEEMNKKATAVNDAFEEFSDLVLSKDMDPEKAQIRAARKYGLAETPMKEFDTDEEARRYMQDATRRGDPARATVRGRAAPAKSGPQPRPKVGSVVNGYEYMGGDPSDSKSWKKVAASGKVK